MPKSQIDNLLDMWAASMLYAHPDLAESAAPFANTKDLLDTIDEIKVGNVPWKFFVYNKPDDLPDNAPKWMSQEYVVWYRDVDQTLENMLANPDFAKEFDFVPYHEYNAKDERRYGDFFSGDWAWEQAVRTLFMLM